MRSRKFKTLAEARKFHKANQDKFGWHVRKISGAKVWRFFVGSDVEWLNL